MRVTNTILFLLVSIIAMNAKEYKTNSLYIGDPSWQDFTKNFNIVGHDDKVISLGKFEHKLVAFYFSASWCGPCKRVNKKIIELHNKYSDVFEVVLVSLDNENGTKRQIYFKENFNYMLDITKNQARQYMMSFVKRGAMPSMIVFDQNRNFWMSDFQNHLLYNTKQVSEIFDKILIQKNNIKK